MSIKFVILLHSIEFGFSSLVKDLKETFIPVFMQFVLKPSLSPFVISSEFSPIFPVHGKAVDTDDVV